MTDEDFAALLARFDAHLEKMDGSLLRQEAVMERNTQALDRNKEAFDRNTEAFERHGRAFERHGQFILGAMNGVVRTLDDMRDEIRANTRAVLKLLDRFDERGETA